MTLAGFCNYNYIYETEGMTGILEQLKWESLEKKQRDSRIILLYKGLKGAASLPTNDLVPQLDISESITLWYLNPLANILTFKRAVSSHRLLEIGIRLQILSFLLLKVQKTLLLSSLLL